MDTVPMLHNPYIGPRFFRRDPEEAKLFFGRDEDASRLLVRVQTERLTLFYAQSGAGKSSLINARLIPGLEERGFVVLPVARVGGTPPPDLMSRIDNVFMFNLMTEIDSDESVSERCVDVTLSDFLGRLVSDDGEHFHYDPDRQIPSSPQAQGVPYVLVIDQFEEILTHHTTRWPDREDFFRQLDQAMRDDPNLWVVLSLREDFVARIEPYASLLADRMRSRLYMERMQPHQALDAVRKPAERFDHPFEPEAAEVLVKNLRQVREVGQETVPGPYVEPVQLQVVCLQLWESLNSSGGQHITVADLERLAGGRSFADFVDQALMDFYNRSLQEVLADAEVAALPQAVTESSLRRFFSQQLVTELGTRGFVLQGDGETGGLPNLVLNKLRDRYLLRAESRAGGIWYELIHDRFVAPIQRSNREWFARNQNPLTRVAKAWQASGESKEKLLTGADLDDAKSQLAATPGEYTDLERDFVDSSTKAAQNAANKRQRQIIAIAIAFAVLFAALSGWAFQQRSNAQKAQATAELNKAEAQRSLSSQLAVQAVSANENDPELGFLLAVESLNVLLQDNEDLSNPLAIQTLASMLSDSSLDGSINLGVSVDRIEANLTSDFAVFSTSEGLIAAPWPDIDSSSSISRTVLADRPVLDWVVSYDHSRVAFIATESRDQSGANDPKGEDSQQSSPNRDSTSSTVIEVWGMTSSGASNLSQLKNQGEVTTIGFSPDGNQLFVGLSSGTVRIHNLPEGWNPGSRATSTSLPTVPYTQQTLQGHSAAVETMDIALDGSLLVTGGLDATVQIWQLGSNQEPLSINGHHLGSISRVAFSPDKQWLASGDASGRINLTQMPDVIGTSELVTSRLTRFPAGTSSLQFSPDSKWLAATSNDGFLQIWDLSRKDITETPESLHRNTTPIKEVGFAPSSSWLYAVEDNRRTIYRWDLQADDVPNSRIAIQTGSHNISALAPSGHSEELSIGTTNGDVVHWSLDKNYLIDLACQIVGRNMTIAEWEEFFTGKPYRQTCASLPTHTSVRDAYINTARTRASQGEIPEARAKLHEVVKVGIELSDEEMEFIVVDGLRTSVFELAREGSEEQALAIVERANTEAREVVISPDQVTQVVQAWELTQEILALARSGKLSQEETLAQLEVIEADDPELRSAHQDAIDSIFNRTGPRFGSEYLYGLHDPGGEHLMLTAGVSGWVLFKEAIGHDPEDSSGNDYSHWSSQGLGVIVNLVNGWYPNGTLPHSSQYENFAQRCGNFVEASSGAAIWVIGNEMNHEQERPRANAGNGSVEAITPELYARAFSLCREAIKSVPGHEGDEVLVGAVSPWNIQTRYAGNPNGDWVQYFADILTLLGPDGTDGFAIHTYTRAHDPSMIQAEVRFSNPVYRHLQDEFRSYRDFMNAVPDNMRTLSAYITETDPTDPNIGWEPPDNLGWVQQAYEEIDSWNSDPNNQKIRSLILYRWPNISGQEQWAISTRPGIIEDFQDALRHSYRWTTTDLERRAIALAREGKINEAVSLMRQVVEENPSLRIDPTERVGQLYAPVLVEEAESLARQGEIDEAIALFTQANEYDPTFIVGPEVRTGQLYASVLVEEAESLARQGALDDAVALFTRANGHDPTLAIDPEARATALASHPIAYGETVTGTVESGQGEHWLFEGRAGDTVTIAQSDLGSSGLDTYLTLYGSGGGVVAENDDFNGRDSRIDAFTLPDDGTYVILAGGYGASEGDYVLELRRE